MAAFVRLQGNIFRRPIFVPLKAIRLISTSKKNRDTATISEPIETKQTKTECVPVKKNWISYGFDFTNEDKDLNAMHSTFFFSITVCIVFGGFLLAYFPDYRMRDWSQREAYLELRRREELGLLPIDSNLIDPSKIVLPTDEELGDTEIII